MTMRERSLIVYHNDGHHLPKTLETYRTASSKLSQSAERLLMCFIQALVSLVPNATVFNSMQYPPSQKMEVRDSPRKPYSSIDQPHLVEMLQLDHPADNECLPFDLLDSIVPRL